MGYSVLFSRLFCILSCFPLSLSYFLRDTKFKGQLNLIHKFWVPVLSRHTGSTRSHEATTAVNFCGQWPNSSLHRNATYNMIAKHKKTSIPLSTRSKTNCSRVPCVSRVDIEARIPTTTTGEKPETCTALARVCVQRLVHQTPAFESERVGALKVSAAPTLVVHDGVLVGVQVSAVASVAAVRTDDASGHGERVWALGAVLVDFDGHQ